MIVSLSASRTQKCRVPCDSISKLQTQASLFRTRTTLSPPTLTHTVPSPAQNAVPFPCAPSPHNLRTKPPPLDLHRFNTGTSPIATSPFSTSLPARRRYVQRGCFAPRFRRSWFVSVLDLVFDFVRS
ncbi:hypothetical protein GmHk_06G016002 [Glycine max]|nr:hypothetical protein GmHk_06G016002 [Glycine max]